MITVARMRREVPAFDNACNAAGFLNQSWTARVATAYCDPDTRHVSIVLRALESDLADADRFLGQYSIPAGGWTAERIAGCTFWRKPVTS